LFLLPCCFCSPGGFAFSSRPHDDVQHPSSPDSSSAPHQHQGPAFAFDYGNTSGTSLQHSSGAGGSQYKPPPLLPLEASSAAAAAAAAGPGADEAGGYSPPFETIPDDLRWHLPSSEREHQVCAVQLQGTSQP
jgi:hypothetical protein